MSQQQPNEAFKVSAEQQMLSAVTVISGQNASSTNVVTETLEPERISLKWDISSKTGDTIRYLAYDNHDSGNFEDTVALHLAKDENSTTVIVWFVINPYSGEVAPHTIIEDYDKDVIQGKVEQAKQEIDVISGKIFAVICPNLVDVVGTSGS